MLADCIGKATILEELRNTLSVEHKSFGTFALQKIVGIQV
jgi:hypothetical protein